jgi:hypothetical protein
LHVAAASGAAPSARITNFNSSGMTMVEMRARMAKSASSEGPTTTTINGVQATWDKARNEWMVEGDTRVCSRFPLQGPKECAGVDAYGVPLSPSMSRRTARIFRRRFRITFTPRITRHPLAKTSSRSVQPSLREPGVRSSEDHGSPSGPRWIPERHGALGSMAPQ